jgi:hypothetical protein
MKTRSMINVMVCLAGLATVATAQAQDVVISAVYGGANATSAISHDFVELRNRTGTPVDISGWSLQYSSATGTSWGSQKVVFAPGSSVPANGFFLVRLAAGAATVTANITNFDASAGFNYAGVNGKLALVNNDVSLPVEVCPSNPAIVDKVSYGTGNCPEGTAATGASIANAIVRLSDGCTDTNNNSADFVSTITGLDVGQFFPRWSGSPAGASCGVLITDCNNNGIDDAIDIAGNPALDCDTNGVIDSCELSGNDCDNNGVLDSCDIAGNPALDCNTNGVIDSCELAANDCDNNGVLDSCDIAANPALDANTNGIIDSCEGTSLASVIISEVVDGPLSGGQPKYIEITNLSTVDTVTFGVGDSIKRYSNGELTPDQTFSLNGVSLSPSQSYVIANPAGGVTLPPAAWIQAYGIFNLPSAYDAVASGNGNDAFAIERSGTIIDTFGAIGVDGFGTAWDYTDSYARRKPGICAGSGTFSESEWIFGGPNGLEQTLLNASVTDSNVASLYASNLLHLTSPNSHANTCNGNINDCNDNGVDDSLDIAGGIPDCNANGVPDSCDIAFGAQDCNTNGIPDNCDILSGAFPDANATGIPDVCDAFQSDCNNNFIEDADEIAGGAPDCNNNGILDECEPLIIVDADGNLTGDLCEGAFVGEAFENATVQAAGVRTAPNGLAFFNIQGIGSDPLNPSAFASYGGTRFDLAPLVTQFDAQFGAGNWQVERAYVRVVQNNAAFTNPGDVSIQHTNNDTADFVPAAAVHAPFYADFATDFADAQEAVAYAFTGSGNVGSGTVENYVLFDLNASNLPGGQAIASEINAGSGPLTVLFRDASPAVAATYAGLSNNTYLGPTLVVFAIEGGANPCPPCAADYDNNGGVDGGDLGAFFADFEAGETCADVDGNGGVDGGDLGFFFAVFEAGGC